MKRKLCRLLLALAMALSPTLAPAATDAQTAASSCESQRRTEDNRNLVKAAFDRWAAGGTSFFDEVIAPNVVWRIEGSGSSAGIFRGRSEFMDKAVRPFTSRLSRPVRPVDVRIFADGDHVIAHWEGRATARDGNEYRNRYTWILHMQDGKAIEVWAFLDLAPYDDILRRIPAPEEHAMATQPYVGRIGQSRHAMMLSEVTFERALNHHVPRVAGERSVSCASSLPVPPMDWVVPRPAPS